MRRRSRSSPFHTNGSYLSRAGKITDAADIKTSPGTCVFLFRHFRIVLTSRPNNPTLIGFKVCATLAVAQKATPEIFHRLTKPSFLHATDLPGLVSSSDLVFKVSTSVN